MLIKNKPVTLTFFITLFQTMSTGVMFSLTVLYLTLSLNVSEAEAYMLNTALFSLFYCLPLISGMVADKFLDAKRTLIIGQLFSIVGFFTLASMGTNMLVVSLSCIAIGGAFYLPSIWKLLHSCFPEHNSKRSYYFTVAYISLATGGMISTFSSGFIADHFGYHTAFYIGGIYNVIALVLFILFHRIYPRSSYQFSLAKIGYSVCILILTFAAVHYLIQRPNTAAMVIYIAAIALFFYFLYLAKTADNANQTKGILKFVILCLICVTYWSIATLSQTNITLFSQYNLNRYIFGIIYPAGSVITFWYISMFICAIAVSTLWYRNIKHNAFDLKFFIGLVVTAIAGITIPISIGLSASGAQVAFFWIIIFFFFLGFGEILIHPNGSAAAGEYITEKNRGFALGAWEFSSGLGVAISGKLSILTITDDKQTNLLLSNQAYSRTFLYIAIICFAFGVVTYLVNRLLKTH
ncbi:MFS transporter [Fastidiosibacter lacustris]|uniref:MFS transporter n=1 Tax=Fastidiosibacter lacustris TaxID=2056695 RepID=UPI000E34351B|nr:MFS transporter [Fastidiosibacter lacustris]